MSGLALVARELGAEVTGSDRSGAPRTRRVCARPASTRRGHDAANVPAAPRSSYSTAIPPENPERAARERG